jgi:hypothetical protein
MKKRMPPPKLGNDARKRAMRFLMFLLKLLTLPAQPDASF